MDATVSALFVYPVKSCRGIALARADVEARGIRHDRRWMVVDEGGRFITQRTQPRLALVEVSIEGDLLAMRAPGLPTLRVEVAPRSDAPRRRVQVWRHEGDAVDCGGDASRWLSRWLDAPASLVFMPDDVRRAVDPDYALEGDIVGFADGYPLLLATTSSLDDLNGRMDRPLPMDRFRPNVVVSGCAPWAEDGWQRLRVGDVVVRVAKPCARCVITTIDQVTAEAGVEPMRTLATFRGQDNNVLFAQNCVPDASGIVAVGDGVTVLEGRGMPAT